MQLLQSNNIHINQIKAENFGQELNNNDIIDIIWLTTKHNNHVVKLSNNIKKDSLIDLVIFNKPAWYVVSKWDTHNKDIYTILPKEFENYYYIGRLDKDSTGILLLTNDGELANQMAHPSFDKDKKYVVWVRTMPTDQDLQSMVNGTEVMIYDKPVWLDFVDINIIWPRKLQITLAEGKNRHIKRLIQHFGYHCTSIHRSNFGEYELWNLIPGEYKIIKIKKTLEKIKNKK